MQANIQRVRRQIAAACAGCTPPRPPESVTLLAVSKRHPAAAVAQANRLGIGDFGENYVQEAVCKAAKLGGDARLTWHLVGPVQANKTKDAAALFDWFHALDRIKIAVRLGAARVAAGLAPLNATVQVNLGGEATKNGLAPEAVSDFLSRLDGIAGLQVRGLMCLPEPHLDSAGKNARFDQLAALLRSAPSPMRLDTLSMGMSDDFVQAIRAGATIIRPGTAIFGARP